MKILFTLLFSLIFTLLTYSQTLDGNWSNDYSTYDNASNGTGYNTISVAVLSEDTFAALVYRAEDQATNYLIGFRDADSAMGRISEAEGAGFIASWFSGFFEIQLNTALDLAHFNDQIFLTNNDENHNILVYEMTETSVEPAELRLETGTDQIWAIDTDLNGKVYVTAAGSESTNGKVLVYESTANETAWSDGHVAAPLQVVDIPEEGSLRGVTVNDEGTELFVSNHEARKVYKFIGDPETGYELDFDFEFTIEDSIMEDEKLPGPWGLNYMFDKNLLFAASDFDFIAGGNAYEYAKMFVLNPNNGNVLDTINVAQWNFDRIGSYNSRPGGTDPGNASGYSSTYNIDFDQNYNVYSQSFFGWTVEKWSYDGTLPVITSVELKNSSLPSEYSLKQNYPNPFNPSTTIEFSIPEKSNIDLNIYSVNGELVGTAIDSEDFEAGTYKVTLNMKNYSSGIYIYSLNSGKVKLTNKMVLVK